MDNIYLITTFTHFEYRDDMWPELGSLRTVGWYPTYENALNAVSHNYGDIWETIYDYAVIECVEPGLYPYVGPTQRWFFKYNIETGNYEPIVEPEYMVRYGNIGIG